MLLSENMNQKPTAFANKVYEQLKKVPKGRVTTYKILAQSVGTQAYQAIGTALRNNPFAPQVPCHRVVATDGRIGGFKGKKSGKTILEKMRLLESEGITFKEQKVVDFDKKLFIPK